MRSRPHTLAEFSLHAVSTMPVPKKTIARVQSPREKARHAMNTQKPIKSSGNRTRVFITHLPLGDPARPWYRPMPWVEHKQGHSDHHGGPLKPWRKVPIT